LGNYLDSIKENFEGFGVQETVSSLEGHIRRFDFRKAQEELIELADQLGISMGSERIEK
jgi:hypothetical protein